jgi:hypothetical protein
MARTVPATFAEDSDLRPFQLAKPSTTHPRRGGAASRCAGAADYVRLLERGIEDRAYAGPLARYAVAQYRAGRRAAERINSRDVLANACQLRHGRTLERLSCFDSSLGEWGEAIVEDRRYGPANAASMRVDFAAWLQSLPTRDRRVAETLATGETTSTVAQLFNVSAARIAQLRRELQRNWLVFQGETIPSTT